jgi:uncharacterized membrane protein
MNNGFFDLPVHPIVVHFPIALLTLTWVMIIAGHAGWGNSERWLATAPTLEWIGVIAFAPTVLTGFRDAGWFELFDDIAFAQPLIWHVMFAVATVMAYTGHAIWRHGRVIQGVAVRIDLGLASIGFWLLTMTGLMAGEVVYG